jgi:LAS superfamily LD-carboxypeptidase LdcB
MNKGTGKYYKPVYRAKKTPAKVKRAKIIKRSVLACLAVAAVAAGIFVWQSANVENDSFIEVFAAGHSLSNVEVYPRVVSAEHPVAQSYEPENLVSLNTVPNGESIYLRRDTAESFIEMLSAMAGDGLAVIPIKGYTSFAEQTEAQTQSIDKFIAAGYSSDEAASMTSAQLLTPGADEAQLGTSIDVSTEMDSVANFSATEQCEWLCNNAHKFGFIIRYTESKQSITGIEAKPWHLRYVGVSAATYMKNQNLCLEEYVELVKKDNPAATQEN